ncbi:MAG: metalloregulator ArsR/SmtB family transcription factor [Nitrospiraceae bacterium]|nr:metalloregulator ArsR/SmtB family transcription factor [Nitrospiraceae bacterium]
MEELLNIFKAFSDETRLRILKLLEHGELCVCDLVAALELVQPKISFHLAILREADLVKDRKEGKWTHYRLNESDMFRRMLLYSAIERIPVGSIAQDMARLEKFLGQKTGVKIEKTTKKSAVLREVR